VVKGGIEMTEEQTCFHFYEIRGKILKLEEEYRNLRIISRSVENQKEFSEFNRGQLALINKIIGDLEGLLK
jgi:hypothetical protein